MYLFHFFTSPLGYPGWYKNDKLIESQPGDRVTIYNRTSGKRLLIKETLLEDQATYKCEVDNGVGQKQSHSMKLTVVSEYLKTLLDDKLLIALSNIQTFNGV